MKEPQVSKKTLNLNGRLLPLNTPLVMGILNLTPDSFYSKSRYWGNLDKIIAKAEQMLIQGATFLDIGGYSTRPGAKDVSESEEKDRVLRVIESIKKNFPEAILTIDTFRASVARAAIKAGASAVNDVSGGNLDALMFTTVAELKVPYILMHMQGTPQTMNKLTNYTDLVRDIVVELKTKMRQLRAIGICEIIVDPGFGFAKTVQQNFELLSSLHHLHELDSPILIGISRKSLIWRSLGVTADDALNGTSVLNTIALTKKIQILRVHDVKEAVEAIKLNELTIG